VNFGAVADGNAEAGTGTDDSNAFRRALAAGPRDRDGISNTPADIFIPNGVYRANITIADIQNVRLYGQSQYAAIIPAVPASPALRIVASNAIVEDVHVHDLRLQGTGREAVGIVAGSVGLLVDCDANGLWDSRFEDVVIDNFSIGVKKSSGTNCFYNRFAGIRITNTNQFGFLNQGGEYETFTDLWATATVGGMSISNSGFCGSNDVFVNTIIDGKLYDCGNNNLWLGVQSEYDSTVGSQAGPGDPANNPAVPVFAFHGASVTVANAMSNGYPPAKAATGMVLAGTHQTISGFMMFGARHPSTAVMLGPGSSGSLANVNSSTARKIDQSSSSEAIAAWDMQGDTASVITPARGGR
jgi:hypothetical protein